MSKGLLNLAEVPVASNEPEFNVVPARVVTAVVRLRGPTWIAPPICAALNVITPAFAVCPLVTFTPVISP